MWVIWNIYRRINYWKKVVIQEEKQEKKDSKENDEIIEKNLKSKENEKEERELAKKILSQGNANILKEKLLRQAEEKEIE